MLTKQTKILILLCLMVTVGRFALDSYLPSLPAIMQYFHTSSAQTQLTLTTFLVGFATSQLIYGALSDRYGRRKIILSGFTLFLAGLLLCSIATSMTFLLIARFIAGIGAGVSSSLKRAVASDIFQDIELAKASANQSNAVLITILIAPVIGGYVQAYYGWRANFLLSFSYAAIIFSLLYKYLPDTRSDKHELHLLTLSNIFKNYISVLKYTPFITNVTYSTCAFTGMVIYSQVSAFLLIDTLHQSASTFGWLTTLIAISYLLAGVIVNRANKILGMQRLIAIGIILLCSAGVILLIESQFNILTINSLIVPALIYILGARIIIPNAMARSISPFPSIAGYASALISVIQTLGAALGSFIISRYYYPNLLPIAVAFILLSVISLSVFIIYESELLRGSLKRSPQSVG